MDEIKVLAAQAAIRRMVNSGSLSICTIREVVKMLGVIPDARAFQIMETLHCVDFKDMDPALVREIPTLLYAVLGGQNLDMNIEDLFIKKKLIVVDKPAADPEPPKPTGLKALMRGW